MDDIALIQNKISRDEAANHIGWGALNNDSSVLTLFINRVSIISLFPDLMQLNFEVLKMAYKVKNGNRTHTIKINTNSKLKYQEPINFGYGQRIMISEGTLGNFDFAMIREQVIDLGNQTNRDTRHLKFHAVVISKNRVRVTWSKNGEVPPVEKTRSIF